MHVLRSLLTFDPRQRPQSQEMLLEFDEVFDMGFEGYCGEGEYSGPSEDDLEL